MNVRAAAYMRVSTNAQRERDTIAAQRDQVPTFCEKQGWPLVATFVDESVSGAGALAERRGLAQMLLAAKAGDFDVLVVLALDRLTRDDPQERGIILGQLHRAGVRVAEARSGLIMDLDSFEGDLLSQLMASMAREERRKIGERTQKGRELAAARGRKPSGPDPFGLRFTKEDGFSIREDEASLIREVVQRVVDGEAMNAIAKDMNRRGELRVGHRRKNGGTPWCAQHIKNFIKKSMYVGAWRTNQHVVPVPPILNAEIQSEAQAVLSGHAAARLSGARPRKHFSLATGRAICGLCGSPMHTSTPQPQHRDHGRYMCKMRRRYGKKYCANPPVAMRIFDAVLWDAVRTLIVDRFDDLEEALLEFTAPNQRGAIEANIADTEKELKKLLRLRERWQDICLWVDDEGEYQKFLTRLKETKDDVGKLRRRISRLKSSLNDIDAPRIEALEEIREFRDFLATAGDLPLEIKNEIVGALISPEQPIVMSPNEWRAFYTPEELVPDMESLSRLSHPVQHKNVVILDVHVGDK
ncbi:MAG: recombinase family protein [Mycobacterium sp.]